MKSVDDVNGELDDVARVVNESSHRTHAAQLWCIDTLRGLNASGMHSPALKSAQVELRDAESTLVDAYGKLLEAADKLAEFQSGKDIGQ